MSFGFRLVVGVALMEAVLLFFLYFGGSLLWFGWEGFRHLFAAGLSVLGFVMVGRYVMQWRGMSDLYRVAREVVPSFEVKYYKPVNFKDMRAEIFKGYYLIEYPSNNITVAWHKSLGVVARERMRLENFKLTFVPESVEKVQPEPVIVESKEGYNENVT